MVVKATYLHPYQMHGSMGTPCAVADVQRDKATVWSPTQSAYPTRSGVAMLLGMPVDNVRVIFVRGAGCYGLNGADTVSFDAALLSQAVGRPVRIQLSRKDENSWENYGSACVIDQRAVGHLPESGRPSNGLDCAVTRRARAGHGDRRRRKRRNGIRFGHHPGRQDEAGGGAELRRCVFRLRSIVAAP